jgi:hypothetical protein
VCERGCSTAFAPPTLDNYTLAITPYYVRKEGDLRWPKKRSFLFAIRADIKAAMQKLADGDRRSLSSYIELALEEHIKAKKKEGKKR